MSQVSEDEDCDEVASCFLCQFPIQTNHHQTGESIAHLSDVISCFQIFSDPFESHERWTSLFSDTRHDDLCNKCQLDVLPFASLSDELEELQLKVQNAVRELLGNMVPAAETVGSREDKMRWRNLKDKCKSILRKRIDREIPAKRPVPPSSRTYARAPKKRREDTKEDSSGNTYIQQIPATEVLIKPDLDLFEFTDYDQQPIICKVESLEPPPPVVDQQPSPPSPQIPTVRQAPPLPRTYARARKQRLDIKEDCSKNAYLQQPVICKVKSPSPPLPPVVEPPLLAKEPKTKQGYIKERAEISTCIRCGRAVAESGMASHQERGCLIVTEAPPVPPSTPASDIQVFPFDCPYCGLPFSAQLSLTTHVKSAHGTEVYTVRHWYPMETLNPMKLANVSQSQFEKCCDIVFQDLAKQFKVSRCHWDKKGFDCPLCSTTVQQVRYIPSHLCIKHFSEVRAKLEELQQQILDAPPAEEEALVKYESLEFINENDDEGVPEMDPLL